MAAMQLGYPKPQLEGALPRLAELPFSSEQKRMTTIHQVGGNCRDLWAEFLGRGDPPPYVLFTKGAFDLLLQACNGVWVNGKIEPLDEWRKGLEQTNGELSQAGLRVLAVAFRFLAALPQEVTEELEKDLVFLGLVGMMDPLRPEAKGAVETCRQAGIDPVMITGDHPLTALAIARKLGLDTGRILTGSQLDGFSPEDLVQIAEEVAVYARVSPSHKLKIVEALQRRGHVVAMTGDGVNDAPALKKADIGVAMGVAGTDVAKEAADMVLLDDNFATIVAPVEEGRVIYDNIQKFLK